MKKVDAYEVIHISVDCECNDLTDMKCGGPATLGYDFYVDADCDTKDMKLFIKNELKKNRQPLMSISIGEKTVQTSFWTKEMISDCISNGYR